MEKKNLSPKEVESYMNKKCGFDGISGVGSDSRDVEKAMKEGNERAKLAYDMLCYQIKKFIGAYSDFVFTEADDNDERIYIVARCIKE